MEDKEGNRAYGGEKLMNYVSWALQRGRRYVIIPEFSGKIRKREIRKIGEILKKIKVKLIKKFKSAQKLKQ